MRLPKPRSSSLTHSREGGLFLLLLAGALGALGVNGQSVPHLTGFDPQGRLSWTNAPVPGVCTVEVALTAEGDWLPQQNVYALASTGQLSVALDAPSKFIRLRAVDIQPTAQGFTNFIQSYGLLETICGNGVGRVDGLSYWLPQFEGGPAVNASLSRPHVALADAAGNIYIADKNSQAVLRVAPSGLVYTHAGTHVGGFNGEGPAAATSLQLNYPNALWVRRDGTVYVLDTGNARVRRVATNGVMSTLFNAKNDPSTPLGGGRALWVKDDESLAYFGNTDRIRKWTPANGLQTLAGGFVELGGFYVESDGSLIVADRGANYVYRVFADGTRTTIAGTGATTGGGDGFAALQTGLSGPRGVWAVPTGGYLLLLHDGAQLWYVDGGNTMHLLINGVGGNEFVHGGDGQYFYAPDQFNIGEGRSVAMDEAGNIIICESDYGFIRRIRFQRMN